MENAYRELSTMLPAEILKKQITVEKNKKITGIFLLLTDIFSWLFCFLLGIAALLLLNNKTSINFIDWWHSTGTNQVLIYFLFSLTATFLFWKNDHYNERNPFWTETGEVVRIVTILGLLNGSVVVATSLPFSRTVWLASFTSCFIILPVFRIVCRKILDYFGCWKIPTIIIGHGEAATSIFTAINNEKNLGYDIIAIIHSDMARNFEFHECQTISWPKKSFPLLIEIIKRLNIIYAVEQSDEPKYPRCLKSISRHSLKFHIAPTKITLPIISMKAQHFFSHDIMMLSTKNNLLNKNEQKLKRFIDIILSIVLIVLVSPIMLMIALMIKHEGGPVFFSQPRNGKNNKPFLCMKFRTMHQDAEARMEELFASDPVIADEWQQFRKLRSDPRITKTGQLLRKTSLDELPQLFNVLIGEMSLVGPRPRLLDEPSDFYYSAVRPGITGLWQVSGRNKLTYAQRINLDRWYVKNWNTWYDFAIFIKTVKVVLLKEGAY
ncbi:undecaprenyl-phosphate galactose phosphotransferase WbaP [Vogesella indigofera]|uniref:undecaprenyl-phosphate galactose phosphotransferase WbaP n=1 Tax=Vogesella indigofera TaxID=45465 RepID=UPI00234D14DA|nr:undecaprenyl-phosphate galactose phosphotransferase WbaP [Vogesella indigofera]MDC7705876.1 undecaprenyl-phosphate galactose phosphotransferase WbaP [Vogesella indigofera]